MSPLLFPRTAFLPWHAGHPRAPATGASEQSEATPRNASDRKASEAKPQIKPHASPGLLDDAGHPRAPATGASEQSEATPRNANDRQASEAKPQIKPHASPGLPGDPWRPLGGQERSDVGAQ